MTGPLGNIESLLRFEVNKIHCSPQDQLLSVVQSGLQSSVIKPKPITKSTDNNTVNQSKLGVITCS